MSFKDISYLKLGQPFCSVDHLRYFGRGYQEKQFCEIISNLDQWFRMSFKKDFLSGGLAALLLSGAEPFGQL